MSKNHPQYTPIETVKKMDFDQGAIPLRYV